MCSSSTAGCLLPAVALALAAVVLCFWFSLIVAFTFSRYSRNFFFLLVLFAKYSWIAVKHCKQASGMTGSYALVHFIASVAIKANRWHTQCIVNTPLLLEWNVSGVLEMSPAVITSHTSCRSWRRCLPNRMHTPR